MEDKGVPSLSSQVPVTINFNQDNFNEGGLFIWSDNNLLSDIRLWRNEQDSQEMSVVNLILTSYASILLFNRYK